MKRYFLAVCGALIAALSSVANAAHAAVLGYMHNTGLMLTLRDTMPTPEDFMDRRVTNPNQSEVIRQSLYDFQLYPTAGQTALNFFQAAQGQGITSAVGAAVGTAKTLADTNMDMAGQLASGVGFLAETVEVLFYPGSVSTANTYTLAAIGSFIAVAALTQVAAANDVNIVLQSGVLRFNVLQKNYLTETPLQRFPPKTYIGGDYALSTNSATTSTLVLQATRGMGRPYYLEPEISLQSAVNFVVRLEWPAAVATPSGFNGRIGIILDGYTWRSSQ